MAHQADQDAHAYGDAQRDEWATLNFLGNALQSIGAKSCCFPPEVSGVTEGSGAVAKSIRHRRQRRHDDLTEVVSLASNRRGGFVRRRSRDRTWRSRSPTFAAA
jgi:hypothetical protein